MDQNSLDSTGGEILQLGPDCPEHLQPGQRVIGEHCTGDGELGMPNGNGKSDVVLMNHST